MLFWSETSLLVCRLVLLLINGRKKVFFWATKVWLNSEKNIRISIRSIRNLVIILYHIVINYIIQYLLPISAMSPMTMFTRAYSIRERNTNTVHPDMNTSIAWNERTFSLNVMASNSHGHVYYLCLNYITTLISRYACRTGSKF